MDEKVPHWSDKYPDFMSTDTKLPHWSNLYRKNIDSEEELNRELVWNDLIKDFLNHYSEDFFFIRKFSETVDSDVTICFNEHKDLIFTYVHNRSLAWVNPFLSNLISNMFGIDNKSLSDQFIFYWITHLKGFRTKDINPQRSRNSGVNNREWEEIKQEFNRAPQTFKQIKTLYPMRITETQLANIIKTVLKEEGFVGDDGSLELGDDQNDANYELVTDYIRSHKIDSHPGSGPYRDYYLPLEAKEYFDFIGFGNYEIFRVDNPDHEDYGKRFVEVKSWII